MDFSKLTQGDKIIAGTGLGLVISLFLLPWHSFDFGVVSDSRSGIQSPNSGYGWLALLLTLAIVGTLIAEKATDAKLPELPVSWADARFYSAIAALAFLLLKYISETNFIGFGAYLGILLAGGMTYGAFVGWQAAKSGDGSADASAGGEDSGSTES